MNFISAIAKGFEPQKRRTPNNVEDCKTVDYVTISLNQWALSTVWVGLGIWVLLFSVGLVSGMEASDLSRKGEEVEAFFKAFMPWVVRGFIVNAICSFASVLMRAIATIVYNTTITANIALMNADQSNNENGTIQPTPNANKTAKAVNVASNSVFGTVPMTGQQKKASEPPKMSKEVSKILDEIEDYND